MAKKGEIYKCEICGNIAEILHEAAPYLYCCGQPMKKQEEQINDPEKGEKHLPVIEGNLVKVGSISHPMTGEHYIEWIEATDGKEVTKVFLKPEEEPKAKFSFKPTFARAYCNLHGLWKC